jgi:hypothetical protein
MTRKNLISLIVLDIIVMALAVGLLAYRFQALASRPASDLIKEINSPVTLVPTETPKPADITTSDKNTASNASNETRNICFTYKNSKAKKVEIIGDFTEWIPRKMTKGGAAHAWKLTFALAPGDYAYNYVVNGKPKRDPNNPKVCNAGRGFPNSFLKVKPLSNDNDKAE